MYGDMLFKRYMKFLCKVRTGRGWGFVLLTRTVWINFMDSDSDYGFIVDVRMYRCRLMDVDSIDILFFVGMPYAGQFHFLGPGALL